MEESTVEEDNEGNGQVLSVLSHVHWQATATARSSGSAGSRQDRAMTAEINEDGS
jgi:hypothetical protein